MHRPRAGSGERAALRHAVPDRHRAQRRPVAVALDAGRGHRRRRPTSRTQPAGTYDDELLNAHFACGDGRCNENIALSSIHQVFHSEHNRLVDDIANDAEQARHPSLPRPTSRPRTALTADGSGRQLRLRRAPLPGRPLRDRDGVPAPRVRGVRRARCSRRSGRSTSTRPDINPAVEAEFAHAVYRFGHSMLDDDVARTTTEANGARTDNSLPLLTAFLNPPEFFARTTGRVRPPTPRARRPEPSSWAPPTRSATSSTSS